MKIICSKCGYEKFNPKNNIHPGVTLQEYIEFEKVNPSAFAKKCRVNPGTIWNILRGYYKISAKTALKIESITGISAEFWCNLQRDYDLFEERKKLKLKGNIGAKK